MLNSSIHVQMAHRTQVKNATHSNEPHSWTVFTS